jgi:hypothetical protein
MSPTGSNPVTRKSKLSELRKKLLDLLPEVFRKFIQVKSRIGWNNFPPKACAKSHLIHQG